MQSARVSVCARALKAKTVAKKEPRDYSRLELTKYDIMIVRNKNKMTYPVTKSISVSQFYAKDFELSDVQ